MAVLGGKIVSVKLFIWVIAITSLSTKIAIKEFVPIKYLVTTKDCPNVAGNLNPAYLITNILIVAKDVCHLWLARITESASANNTLMHVEVDQLFTNA
jgi:hypothetical protein